MGQQNARPEIWSLGHRNAQGMDFQPGSNLMFQTEHGPSGFDGPEEATKSTSSRRERTTVGPPFITPKRAPGLEPPLLEYTPACAPASGAFYRGSVFPQFKGNFFFGCLRGERMIRVVLDGRRVVSQENLLTKLRTHPRRG